MNFWQRLGNQTESPSSQAGGFWQNLIVQTDISKYIPQKIELIEEKKLLSKRAGEYFVVKNQDKVKYLKLTPEDYFLWKNIDGKASFSDLVMSYFQKFGSFAFNRIYSLIGQLRYNYFLNENPVKVFSRLTYISQKNSVSSKVSTFFKAFLHKEVPFSNLDKWLTVLYQNFFWLLFSRPAKWFYVLISLFGIGSFAAYLHSGKFAIIQMQGSYLFGVLIMVLLQIFIILWHEGAHAFATKAYGRQVPRGGFMLYMGMPAFFVDTTDMWLEDKKKRIAVSWAGPYSELIAAGLFGLFIFLFPESAANPILFKCMFLFYFGVFLNMNPLLELDGYYILVDLLEIPMLRRRSFRFVKNELLSKLKARQPFSLNEKIFTIFGVLAGLYTAFAITMALYFWQTRIFDSLGDLWHKGLGSRLFVVFLAVVSMGPIVLFLFMKLLKLSQWVWNQILSNPLFKNVYKGSPVVLGFFSLLACVFLWQKTVPLFWVKAGLGIAFIMGSAHFLFWHWQRVLNKSVFSAPIWLFVSGGLFVFASGILLEHDQAFPFLLLGASDVLFLLTLVFSLKFSGIFKWSSALLGLLIIVSVYGERIFSLDQSIILSQFLMLTVLLSFVFSIQTLFFTRVKAEIPPGKSDEEKLENTFWSLLDFFSECYLAVFSLKTAQQKWEKIETILNQNPGIEKEPEYSFKKGLSILDKSELAEKTFFSVWNQIQLALGSFWSKHFLMQFIDSLGWQEREIAEQYLFKGKGWEKVIVEGKEEGGRSLENILKNNFLFCDLNEEEILQLSRLFHLEQFPAKKAIITQGEVGDKFYIIKNGTVTVRVKSQDGLEQDVALLKEGDFFGEIALLKEIPRTASCLANEPVDVWSLDKESFSHYVKKRFDVSISVERAIEIMRLVSAMPLFKEFSPTQLRKLASSFKVRDFKAGETVIRQGDPGEAFFVIEKGECLVKIKTEQGEEKTVATLGKGEYFGEIALLSNAPRTATVEAKSEVRLLELSKEDFDQLIESTISADSIEKVSSRRKLDLKKKTKLSVAEVS